MAHSSEYNNIVPCEIFDIEDSDEMAELWFNFPASNEFSSLYCDDCGSELTSEAITRGDEYCKECWDNYNKQFDEKFNK